VDSKTFLSAYYDNRGQHSNITTEDVSRAIKWQPPDLNIPLHKAFQLIINIDTHSLHSRGANALSLAGYLVTQIQKMGWWRRATFKEYVHEKLACFLEGMTTSMKK
jgi:hypothetical protein